MILAAMLLLCHLLRPVVDHGGDALCVARPTCVLSAICIHLVVVYALCCGVACVAGMLDKSNYQVVQGNAYTVRGCVCV